MHNNSASQETKKLKHPIFNNEYEIVGSLGEGNTSKVYLAKSLADPKKQVAIKLLREEFLQRDESSIKSVEKEIQILNGLKHQNIVNILGYGSDGHVLKPSGREIKNLVFIMLEYVQGGLLFDLCQTLGGMGEDAGRYFMSQMLDCIEYIHSKGVVHRDLKLENILVDDDVNLKVADFGFATFKKINRLKSYRGTMTYMAPEIKQGKTYDGRQIDIFSIGVILFIIVQGIFPFKEAKLDEYFYNLLCKEKYETYWKKVGGESLSDDFKDLIIKMVNVDGSKRPTLEQLKKHPWMQKKVDMKLERSKLLEKLQEKRSNATCATSRDDATSRGEADNLLEIIRQPITQSLSRKFNDLTDYDVEATPGDILQDLQIFNCDYFESQLKIEANIDKKCILISREGNDEVSEMKIKLKFHQLANVNYDDDNEESELPPRIRLKFNKKLGDHQQWYELLNDMKSTVFEGVLLGPEEHLTDQYTVSTHEDSN